MDTQGGPFLLSETMLPKEISLLFRYLGRYRASVALNLGLLLLLSVFELLGVGAAMPLFQSLTRSEEPIPFMKQVTRVFHVLHLPVTLWTTAGMFFCVVILRYTIQAFQQYQIRALSSHLTHDLRHEVFRKILSFPLAFYHYRKIGSLLTTLTHSSLRAGFSLEFLMQILAAFTLATFLVALGMVLTPFLTLLVGGFLSGMYLLVIPRIRAALLRGREAKKVEDLLNSWAVETLTALKLVKAMNQERFHLDRFGSLNRYLHTLNLKLHRNRVFAQVLAEPLIVLGTLGGVILWVGWFHQPLPLALTFIFILFRLLPQFRKISQNFVLFMEFLPHLSKIDEILTSSIPGPVSGDKNISKVQKEIRFYQVHFRYPGRQEEVLRGVSFTISRGQWVGLFGPSGEGKTTIVDLLLRFYDPTSGQILVDGVDLRRFRLTDWRSLVGLVPQEGYLFHDTLWNNLRYGNPQASEEEILRVAELTGIHALARSLPQGYQTLLGERGVALSGGQKQQLALARALLRDPEILILDEATSALDSAAEAAVKEVLNRIRGEKTILVIAHRFSALVDADLIVVLSRGRVVDMGTHRELLKRCDLYRRNYALQTRRGYTPGGVQSKEKA